MEFEFCKAKKYYECFDKTSELENYYTMYVLRNWVPMLAKTKYRSGAPSLLLLEKTIKVIFDGYAFPPFSPYFEEFNEQINIMMSSGLVSYWIQQEAPGLSDKLKVEEIGPQILTFDHLAVGFYICIASSIIATISFLIETLIPPLMVQGRKIALLAVVRAFIRLNKIAN